MEYAHFSVKVSGESDRNWNGFHKARGKVLPINRTHSHTFKPLNLCDSQKKKKVLPSGYYIYIFYTITKIKMNSLQFLGISRRTVYCAFVGTCDIVRVSMATVKTVKSETKMIFLSETIF